MVDGAKNGEIMTSCKIKEDNKTCEPIKITGTFKQGSEKFPLESDVANLSIENERFSFVVQAEASKSTEKINDQMVVFDFRDSGDIFYKYTLMIHIELDEASKQKLKEAEDRKAAEEAAEAAKKKAEAEAARQKEASDAQTYFEAKKKAENERLSSGLDPCLSKGGVALFSCAVDESTNHLTGAVIKGRLRNDMSKKANSVTVWFGAYDSSGAKVDSCWDSITDLQAGDIWQFEVTGCYVGYKGGSVKLDSIDWW